jgi:hypothetical protein
MMIHRQGFLVPGPHRDQYYHLLNRAPSTAFGSSADPEWKTWQPEPCLQVVEFWRPSTRLASGCSPFLQRPLSRAVSILSNSFRRTPAVALGLEETFLNCEIVHYRTYQIFRRTNAKDAVATLQFLRQRDSKVGGTEGK